jgi:hypothetical protein
MSGRKRRPFKGRDGTNGPLSAGLHCGLDPRGMTDFRLYRHANHRGVRFISVQDQVDIDSPMGRTMSAVTGAMAEPDPPPFISARPLT